MKVKAISIVIFLISNQDWRATGLMSISAEQSEVFHGFGKNLKKREELKRGLVLKQSNGILTSHVFRVTPSVINLRKLLKTYGVISKRSV